MCARVISSSSITGRSPMSGESECMGDDAAVPEGPVCHICGATEASCWYGRKGGPRFCKKAKCVQHWQQMKESDAGSRKRVAMMCSEPQPGDKVSEIYECLGVRCAHALAPQPCTTVMPAPCKPAQVLQYARNEPLCTEEQAPEGATCPRVFAVREVPRGRARQGRRHGLCHQSLDAMGHARRL